MTHEKTVAFPRERAFALFTRGMTDWWPPEYTWAQKTLVQIGIEPHEGGHCFELGPHGFRCDWGRVVTCEPPARIAFTWQITAQRVPQHGRAQRQLGPQRRQGVLQRWMVDRPVAAQLAWRATSTVRSERDDERHREAEHGQPHP